MWYVEAFGPRKRSSIYQTVHFETVDKFSWLGCRKFVIHVDRAASVDVSTERQAMVDSMTVAMDTVFRRETIGNLRTSNETIGHLLVGDNSSSFVRRNCTIWHA